MDRLGKRNAYAQSPKTSLSTPKPEVVKRVTFVKMARFLVTGCFAVFVVALGFQLFNAPAFTAITIEGNQLIPEKSILRFSGLDKNPRPSDVDPYLVSVNLLRSPWIKNARVRFYPPDRLEIWIEERQPFAYFRSAGQVLMIDRDGVLMDPIFNRKGWELPVITHTAVRSMLPSGAQLDLPSFRRVVELFDLLHEHPVIPLSAVSEAVIEGERDLVLITMPRGISIHFGHDDFANKLANLQPVLVELASKQKRVSAIDLRYHNRVSVTP